jgi:hypothetical protein
MVKSTISATTPLFKERARGIREKKLQTKDSNIHENIVS